MTMPELVAEMAGAGLSVRVEADRLMVSPKDLITSAWSERIVAAKPALMAYLTTPAQPICPLCACAAERLVGWHYERVTHSETGERLIQPHAGVLQDIVCSACGAVLETTAYMDEGTCGNPRICWT